MINRQPMLDLVVFIEAMHEEYRNKILTPKEKDFFKSMQIQTRKYGYSFNQGQLDFLSSIYRKVYKNVEV